MSCSVEQRDPPERVFRVGRTNTWALPDWAYAKANGTFGNRWDDPLGVYRVLYTCEQRLGAFMETLGRFRPDEQLAKELDNIEGDELDDGTAPGEVSSTWLDRRTVGAAAITGVYADVGQSRSLLYLRSALATRLVHYGVTVLDTTAIRQHATRELTQEISRHLFDCDDLVFDGIVYGSRFGDEFHNWALFETPNLVDPTTTRIGREDPDLLAALERLDLRMVSP